MRNVRFQILAGCLFMGIALAASAQPETFDGNPNSDAFVRIPRDTDDWTHHISVGALLGMNISANFNESGLFNISGNNAANGIYDDGYVLEDQTGDAGGYTGYWGYDNALQYDATAQTLSMHSATSYFTSGSENDTGSLFAGVEVVYGQNFWYWKHSRVGFDLGVGLLPISITDNRPLSATVNQNTYVYNTGGIVMPGAPYQGGPSGTGEPIIPSTYSSTSSQVLTTGTVTGTRKLDVILYTLRLGPTFCWDLGEHISMSLGVGPAVGLVNGEYRYDEIITTGDSSARNTGSFGATDLVYGGYVNATFRYHVVDNSAADIFAGVQYMPMSSATISGNGRSGRLNLSGQLDFTIGINWPF
ncbi:MAG TPA: hypothetical protein VMB22_00970 [Verrucomicrobiae bacterium]|nr:hypothetical protein [Verrucomicrobiae bacterium]